MKVFVAVLRVLLVLIQFSSFPATILTRNDGTIKD